MPSPAPSPLPSPVDPSGEAFAALCDLARGKCGKLAPEWLARQALRVTEGPTSRCSGRRSRRCSGAPPPPAARG
ncbi:MAG: hypothetical protein ACYCWW_05745 [Deltaproteobacteria bacterium]